MAGLTGALDARIEATLRRDRRVVLSSLGLVAALAWVYLWLDAQAMSAMHMGMQQMPGMASATGPGILAMYFVMWAIMMVGMMLPSAAPTILVYGALVRKNGERGTVLPAVWIFTSGYLFAWTVFSLAVAALQVLLHQSALVTPMMVSASADLSAAILIAAGIYQWLPLKRACLRKCRNPLAFFLTRWRAGGLGAFRMGVENGAYCVACCWVLMLLLFVAGVINLLWVALITVFVFVEKVLPAPKVTTGIAGGVLIAAGLMLLIGA